VTLPCFIEDDGALTRALDRSYLRLDGAMAQAVRQKVVRKFTTSEKSIVLLASLKAGGVGLNLVRVTRARSGSGSMTLTT
jgi:SNF2 family DNA or RNA helicase